MRKLNGFIEVTALINGKKAIIRAESIMAVYDNAEEQVEYGVKPPHRCIIHSGMSLDVVESLDEICDMIYSAEL